MKRAKVRTILAASAMALAFFSGASHAAPNILTYQGRLQEAGGPVTGTRNVQISICDALTAGTCNGTGTVGVSVFNGLFRSTFAVPGNVNLSAGPWYLEVSVGGSPLNPREMLTSTAYALEASMAGEYLRKPALRHTRTAVAHNTSDGPKDGQCSAEFGNYSAANLCEVALINSGRLGSGVMGGAAVGRSFNVKSDATKSYSVDPGAAGSGIVTKTGGSFSLSCISNFAAIRFTSTLVAHTSADGVKDAQCSSEFGPPYSAANILDLASSGGTPVAAGGGPALTASDNSFNIAGNTTHSWAFEGTIFNATISINAVAGGTYRVACIRQ